MSLRRKRNEYGEIPLTTLLCRHGRIDS